MKKLFLFILFVSQSTLAMNIELQPIVERTLTQMLPKPNFSEFLCGKSSQYIRPIEHCEYQCNDSYCVSHCTPSPRDLRKFKYYTEDCTTNSLSIFGDNGLDVQLTSSDFERGGHTWLIALLTGLGTFVQPMGDIELEWASFRSVYRIENGNKSVVPVVEVTGKILYKNSKQSPSFTLIIDRNRIGIEQILILKLGMDDVLFRQRGIYDVF